MSSPGNRKGFNNRDGGEEEMELVKLLEARSQALGTQLAPDMQTDQSANDSRESDGALNGDSLTLVGASARVCFAGLEEEAQETGRGGTTEAIFDNAEVNVRGGQRRPTLGNAAGNSTSELDIMKIVQGRARSARRALLEESNMDQPPNSMAESTPVTNGSTTLDKSTKRAAASTPSGPRPGAYRQAPGKGLERTNTVRFSSLELALPGTSGTSGRSVHSDASPAMDHATMTSTSARRLSIAWPVLGTSNIHLPTAEEVFGETSKSQRPEDVRLRRRKATLTKVILSVGLGVVVLVAVVLVAVEVSQKAYTKSTKTDSSESLSSSVPTMAPTATPLESYIMAKMPSFTTQALDNPESPQALAMTWLMADPNVSELPEWRILQRFALATLYYATKGPTEWYNNTNWLSYSHHECFWFAKPIDCLFCEGDDDLFINLRSNPCGLNLSAQDAEQIYRHEQYLALRLDDNNLVGPLPPEVYLLTSLLSIQMLNNRLSGTVSIAVSQLSNLRRLDLSANALVGSIPTHVFSIPQMVDLSIFGNLLTGTIPTEVGQTNLTYLLLEENFLTGSLPIEVSRNRGLQLVYADRNLLTGTIPSEYGHLAMLKQLYLGENELTSTIPTELGAMSTLDTLDLGGNKNLVGDIPSELGVLDLIFLYLERCMLTSTLPTELCQLQNMTEMWLYDNQLSGSIPTGTLGKGFVLLACDESSH
jgi:hypothetical protein